MSSQFDPLYQIIHLNGQRIYAPLPSVNVKPPPKGTELFIGRLPKNVFEERLLKIFGRFGPIYQLRLMLDFSGSTRGYAFITYFNKSDACVALRCLNNTRIDTNLIVVKFSVDNCRLFLGGIPKNKSEREIREILEHVVQGVKEVIIYMDPEKQNLNRGFAFVEFVNHAKAALARRSLSLGNLVLWDRKITVDWAEPIPQITDDVLATLNRLYLSNVPIHYNNVKLLQIIVDTLKSNHIKKVHKETDYAFVHFENKKYAQEALEKLNNLVLDGQKLRVEWARPVQYNKRNRTNYVPDHFCKSVPPRMRRLILENRKDKETFSVIGLEKSSNLSVSSLQSLQKCQPFNDFSDYKLFY